ncbi:hypothetical protein MNBD_GAMMA01-1871 [hydrothermal vent metagenome]|uniref:Peptidase S54 rhomboid domain-containing protein n=1 Tax=hydrothermal vent metagenome TaxID=652676 RepID=A0A3B0V2V5_9ZZZZ
MSELAFNQNDFHLWQLLTAHFVHYDAMHLMTNILALAILLYLFPPSPIDLVQRLVLSLILIDIYLLVSDVEFYVGFSGLLYVIPGLAARHFLLKKEYWQLILVILLLVFYVFILSTGTNISGEIIWQPLKQAHLLGFAGGFIHFKHTTNS